jgi:preprotein translocase subunit SecB
MADEGNIISDINLDPMPNGADTSPAIGIISQYVKDLSVENPNAPEVYQWQDAPQVGVDFNIGARQIAPEVHEIELKINVTSRGEAGVAFAVELAYCGLIGMRNVSEEQAHPFLFAEGPRILFPFARRIIADAVRDAGFAPLMLEPIDFNGLYLQQLAQRQAEQAAASDAPVGQA